MQSSDFFKIFLSPILKVRKRCAGNGGGAARIAAGRRVRHAWGGGMMRLSSVWMGAGGSGVFSLRCRIGRSAKAMRRCALRRCSCGSARCRRTASEAGRIVFSRDYALWISRLQSGGADPSAPEIERASGRNDPSRAKCRTPCAALLQQCVSGRGAFPVCSRGTSLPPGRTRFGSLVFLLFFVARKLN